jgi:hypothetical protein
MDILSDDNKDYINYITSEEVYVRFHGMKIG